MDKAGKAAVVSRTADFGAALKFDEEFTESDYRMLTRVGYAACNRDADELLYDLNSIATNLSDKPGDEDEESAYA